MYASISHSYAHLILAVGIVREPTVWGFITSPYPDIHYIGWAIEVPSPPSHLTATAVPRIYYQTTSVPEWVSTYQKPTTVATIPSLETPSGQVSCYAMSMRAGADQAA